MNDATLPEPPPWLDDEPPAPRETRRPHTEFESLSEMLAEPDRDFLIDEHIYSDALVVIFGKRGTGKTQYAALSAVSVASGSSLANLRPAAAGAVLLADFEKVWPTRLRPVFAQYDIAEPTRLPIVRLKGWIPDFADLAGVRALVEDCKAHGVRPLMTVVDTLARSSGYDENKDGGLIVRACDHIREHLGGTVCLVAHPGEHNPDRLRGGNQVESAADMVLKIEESAGGIITVTRTKNRYGQQDDVIGTYRKIVVPGIKNGVTLRPAGDVTDTAIELTARDRQTLEALPTSGASFTRWKELATGAGVTATQFPRALDALKKFSLIREDKGRYSRV